MTEHNSPVGYASDIIDQCDAAIERIEKIRTESNWGSYAIESLDKDKKRFEDAKALMLAVLQD